MFGTFITLNTKGKAAVCCGNSFKFVEKAGEWEYMKKQCLVLM